MDIEKIPAPELTLFANTIRMLSADAVEKANSGHPGMPMGMAEISLVLWLKYLNVSPDRPDWLNRDRFVLSNGHGSMLLYSLLHLFGYDLSLEEIQRFRQWESKTPGHPEYGYAPGVEATTGPLGQGLSNAVGMAVGQRLLLERYFTSEPALLNHRVVVFAGDGCMMEGVTSEASSLAGHLGLGNLVVVYDDNHISIAGHTDLAFTEDVVKRYEAYGWHTQRVDGHDLAALDRAFEAAFGETTRPSFIAARTVIGKGSPHKADTEEVHGAPLGKDELAATKKNLNWPLEPSFYVPDAVRRLVAERVEEFRRSYEEWQERFRRWNTRNPELALQLGTQLERSAPADLREKLLAALPRPGPSSTRKLSSEVLQVASKEVNALVGGSADLEPSTLTLIKGSGDVARGSFAGLNLRFGVREHGMGAFLNGLSYYGGYIPYGSTFLCFSDYMRPAIRLAALSHLQALFIFTHDSVFLGEDGPTHQPIEHFNALRIIPNLWVLRPADGVETAVCYSLALGRREGPTALILTRQNLDPLERPAGFDVSSIEQGAYIVSEARESGRGAPVVIVATGSEVPLAVAAAKRLEGSFSAVRVVSMPCVELFRAQLRAEREVLLPRGWNRVVIEAGSPFGWMQLVDGSPENTHLIGIERFGASAPAKVIAERLGFTPESVAQSIEKRFG